MLKLGLQLQEKSRWLHDIATPQTQRMVNRATQLLLS